MDKLTRSKDGKYVLSYTSMNKVVDEVGKLEEITDVSIEIITELFERMVNGKWICIKKTNYVEYIYGVNIDSFVSKEGDKLELGFIYCNNIYRLKDYGKTWAFEKEDVKVEWD